ncbi:nuclear transport factor 2 family protein [Variovorax davisae]|uniref:nuclear transport factor 2 family protein n=1 Tax=Variovorax davisae TaxID=3053515 RepID=UPI002576C5DD|nr:nuclear transport factor 2 family protein [Variovorax sp. J22P271]
MVLQLEDEAACMRLCVDFANHLDARDYPRVLDLFTEDGSLDRMGTLLTGQREIAGFLDARPTAVVTRHLCTNISVRRASGDEATGLCYVLFFQGSADGETAVMSAPPSVVEYHDRFRRTATGWKIQARRIRMAMRA